MKVLLRSCFAADPSDDKALFTRNMLALQESGLDFEITEDQVICNVIRDFVRTYNSVPDISTLREHFVRKKEDECVDRLEQLVALQPLTQGDFIVRLESRAEDRRLRLWSEALKKASIITSTGLEVVTGKGPRAEKKLLKGPLASARFLIEESHTIVAPTIGTRLSGEVTTDGASFKERYERIKADPTYGVGQHTGIEQIDVATNGAKKHELWIHAAYTGGMKSTFALNWVYTQAVYHRHSSCYFSLEMPFDQCQRYIYAMHSYHRKFRAVRHALGLQQDPDSSVGLDAVKVRDANLNDVEEKFLFEYVIPDLENPANKYGRIHIEVADPEKSEYTVPDLRAKAEVLYSQSPYSLLIVDHVGLMDSRTKKSNTTESLNEVILDLRKLAMGFNRGQGMAVVALFQISREGYKAALKAQEKSGVAGYNLTHLSYANEAERSGAIITASWIDDDLKAKNRVQFQCLKMRDGAGFQPFLARVEWPCRRLLTCYEVPQITANEPDKAAQEKAASQLDQ